MPEKKSAAFSARKRLIAVAISACFSTAPAWSNPTGPQVVNGSATMAQTAKLLTVTNSNGAIINWNTFSIGANETTRFNQASANSSVLNRVLANDPSVLLGALSSNGRVWLVNPAGIMVGQGARIDVGGFVASTLNVRNEDFLAGRLNFGATPNAGKIENRGQITTPSGGSVYLIAPAVENHGIINAPNGEVLLAAGQTAQLIDTGTPGVKVDITGADGNVTNLGAIVAEAGRIGMAGVLVKNSGTLNASSLVKEGGRIFLKASEDAYVDGAGRIAATGTKGGSIEVLGNRVAVMDQARLDASGDAGGGTVLVGGDYQGKNPNVQNAERTLIGPGTVIRADARTAGDGGRVIVWADGDTRFYGSISAKGGAQSGDGGFTEVSGRQYLDYRGRANLTAAFGKTGTLLLDPEDIVIVHGVVQLFDHTTDIKFDEPVAGTPTIPGTPATFKSNGSVTSTILTDGSINAQLDLANVLVKTGGTAAGLGDITFMSYPAPIFLGPTLTLAAPTRDLTFDAARNISFTNGTTSVALNGGLLTLRAQTGSITTPASTIISLGGDGALALNSTSLLMIAGIGIGSSLTPLHTSGLTDLAARTATGGIFIADDSGSNVTITTLIGADLDDHSLPTEASGVTTTGGEINIASLGIENTGSITVSSDVSSGVARTTLTAGDRINSGDGTIFAQELVLSAFNGIGAGTGGSGLQTQVTNLQATNTNNGIAIANRGDLTLKDLGAGYAVSNANGGVTLSATATETSGGSITVSNTVTAGERISLRADGDLLIHADLTANTTFAGIASELIADANNDGSGSITQSAETVIGTNGSNLDIGIENILGAGANAVGSGQNIVFGGLVQAGGSRITIRNESGFISTISTDGTGLIRADSLAMRSQQGIDVDTSVNTIAARNGGNNPEKPAGTGDITIRNTIDGAALSLQDFGFELSVAAVLNRGGNISIRNDGSINIVDNVNSGTARTTLSADHQINNGGGTILARDLVLSAVNGIGCGECGGTLFLQTQVTNLQATNTNNGIAIINTGDLTLKDLGAGYAISNPNGGVNISATSSETATGRITVSDMVTAGRKISLRADGDLLINANLTANTTFAGIASELVADANNDGLGSITQSAGTAITTNGSSLDIGIVNILDSSVADAFGSGQNIVLGGTVDAGFGQVTIRNGSGSILTNGTGLITASRLAMISQQGIDVDTSVNTVAARNGGNSLSNPAGSGDIAIRNTNGGTLTLLPFFFESGNVSLQNLNGNISISNDGSINVSSNVDSGTARTTLSAGNTIDGGEGFGTIIAGDLVLSAVNGIGANGIMLQTQVANLQATNTSNGIVIHNTGDLELKDLGAGYAIRNTNGPVRIATFASIEQPGKLTVSDSVTAGQQFSLRADGDLFINANVSGIGLGDSISNFTSELIADAGRRGTGGITQNATSQITMTEGGNLNIGVGCAPGGECGHGIGGTTQNIVLGTVNAGTGTVMIRTENGGVQDANGAGLNITARDLVIRSEQGIDLDTAVSSVDLFNGAVSHTGNIAIRNTGDLTVDSIFLGRGVENQGGAVTLTAGGSLTLNSSVSAFGNVDLVTGNIFTNNVGAEALSAGGSWNIWVADPTKLILGGLTEDFRQYNATFGTTPVQTTTPGNGLLFSFAPSVSPAISGTTSRPYDGTTNATDLVLSAEGAFSGDSIAFSALGGTYQYVDRNVGISKPLDANTVSVIVTNGAVPVPVYGYQFDLKGGDVTRRSVTLTAPAVTKTYNGDATYITQTTDLASFSTALVGGDTVSAAAFAYTNRNAGIGTKTVTFDAATINDGNNGANYAVTLAGNNASTINPLAVTLAAPAVTKTYDGNNGYTAKTADLTALSGHLVGGDTVSTATIAYTNKNAGIGTKTVTFDAATINDGNNGANYAVTLAGNNASSINPLAVTLAAPAVTKTYDGNTAYTTQTAELTAFSGQLVGGDTVSAAKIVYADKNAGTGNKAVTFDAATINDGNGGANYAVTLAGNSLSTITVRPLSIWTGGATGNWSLASNWDALPDLSNVLAVSVPAGNSVTYDAAAGSTNLASLTAAGLSIAGGNLNIANSLTVNSSFSQTGGTLVFGGGASASITQASGNLNLPAFAVANLSLKAPAGAITQSGRIAALTLNTQSQGATTLTNPDNQISNRVDMTAGGPLKLAASGDLILGAIDAGTNPVEIKAGGAILKALGTETSTNIIGAAADLTSVFGGAAGDLAISADTQITGALTATVGAEADHGGIRIKNSGAQPLSVTLTDNALAGSSVSFLNTGNITSTSGFTLKTSKGGDLALLSNGNITWDGGSLSTPSGSVLMSADGAISVTGALSSPVDLALSSKLAINVSGSASTGGTGTAAFTAPSVAINGSVNAADDVGIIADTINLGAASSTGAGHDVIIAAGNVVATNATVSARHDISAAVTGDLRLNGSGFTAGNDIFVNMLGATSTLYIDDVAGLPHAFLWAQAPGTIHLGFPARAGGGMVVDGVAADPLTFATAAGASGLFNGAARAPATLGAGLEVVYANGAAAPGTTIAPTVANAVIAAISASTTPVAGPTPAAILGANQPPQSGSGGTLGSADQIGGTEGTFGGPSGAKKDDKDDKDKKDAETGLKKQADKPTAKKLATCS